MNNFKKQNKNSTNKYKKTKIFSNYYYLKTNISDNKINSNYNFFKIEKKPVDNTKKNSFSILNKILNCNKNNIKKINDFIIKNKSTNNLKNSKKDILLGKYNSLNKSIKVKSIKNNLSNNIKLNRKKEILNKKNTKSNEKNTKNENILNQDDNEIILISHSNNFLRLLKFNNNKDNKIINYSLNLKNISWKNDNYCGNICYTKCITDNNLYYFILKGFLWSYNNIINEWKIIDKNLNFYNFFSSDIVKLSNDTFIILFGKNIEKNIFLEYPILVKNFNKIILKENKLNYFLPESRVHQFIEFSKINNEIILIGGINNENKVLNDIWIFNINKFKWKKLKKKFNKNLEINDYISNTSGFLTQERAITSTINILIFGGINNQIKLNNDLMQYSINIKTNLCVINTIETVGKKPEERMDHNFFKLNNNNNNFAILIGGKNDFLYEKYYDITFNDIWVLCLYKFHWIKLKRDIEGFYATSIVYKDDKVIVFGGLDKENYRENNPLELYINALN